MAAGSETEIGLVRRDANMRPQPFVSIMGDKEMLLTGVVEDAPEGRDSCINKMGMGIF